MPTGTHLTQTDPPLPGRALVQYPEAEQYSNVCSSDASGLSWKPPPAPAIADYAEPAEVGRARPVWVDLEKVCVHDPAQARTVVDGLDMTGRARGMLVDWHRSARGEWLGVVHYQVHYADGRPRPLIFREQLVPLYALEQRTDSVPLG